MNYFKFLFTKWNKHVDFEIDCFNIILKYANIYMSTNCCIMIFQRRKNRLTSSILKSIA